MRIYLATEPTDMRKGHDGLAALVKRGLSHDVYSGHLYVFVSRKGNRIKILAWDHGGFILWYKVSVRPATSPDLSFTSPRLERGRFRVPSVDAEQSAVELESQLSMLLDGIDYSRVRKPIRWEPPRS